MADTERPDGSLAPVTYLFGAPPEPESEQTGRSVQRASELATPRTVNAAGEPGWAVPGVDPTVAPSELIEPATKARALDRAAVSETAGAPDVAEKDEPDTTRAHNVGLHALAKRGQSVAEMTKLLENRELEPDVVAAEIKRLKSVGLLDDFALAETLVRTLSERKKLGKSSIASELRQRKINPIAIDSALEALDGDDELSRATEVAIKRAGQLRSYDETTAKRRLTAYLQRRGYSGSVLSGAMSAAFHPAGGSRGGGPRFE
jgi:SOS response regulatory protein OraA/RecX